MCVHVLWLDSLRCMKWFLSLHVHNTNESRRKIMYRDIFASSENSDQSAHLHSLIWVFDIRSLAIQIFKISSGQRMRRLIWVFSGRTCPQYMYLMLWQRYFNIMRSARKWPLCNLRTTQAQISLRISAGWSGPSSSAYRINGYCSICRRTENAQIRLHRCARWSGPTLSARCIRALFVRWASYENKKNFAESA